MEGVDFTRFALAFIFVVGLIGALGIFLKRYSNKKMFGLQGEGSRIQILEVRYLDPRRRLMLIRRDEAEHLLLLGDGRETVIESNIKKTGT